MGVAALQYSHAGHLRKNILNIDASLTMAWDDGKKSARLIRLCDEILRWASVV